jgi:hypothetical protein
MHRHTDKIKQKDSYEARVVHMVRFAVRGTYGTYDIFWYIWYMWYILVYMVHIVYFGIDAFVSNYVLCIRIKPTSVYEVMQIYYIISIVKLRHVSATFCVLLQGDFGQYLPYRKMFRGFFFA